MKSRWTVGIAAAAVALGSVGVAQSGGHLNPIVTLLAAKKPVFGLYAPTAGRGGGGGAGRGRAAGAGAGGDSAQGRGGRGRGAGQPADSTPPKTPADLAKEIFAYPNSDYVFSGDMEGNFDGGYARFSPVVKAMLAGSSATERWKHPVAVKVHKVWEDTTLAAEHIAKQLNMGVSNIVLVEVESAKEVEFAIRAMRFKSKGGLRPDADVGDGPAYWGLNEKDYRAKADVWPLNQRGELTLWAIVETKIGLEHIKEIAAVKGVGVLFPGAGTLRGLFSTRDSVTRQVTRDSVTWEGAIQSVLSACKANNVPCGFPPGPNDVEKRLKEGFGVMVINWGEAGFRTIDLGRAAAGSK